MTTDELRIWLAEQFPELVRQAHADTGQLQKDLAGELQLARQNLYEKLNRIHAFSAAEVIYLTRKYNIDIPGGTQCPST